MDAAFKAGLDLIKPGDSPTAIVALVTDGHLSDAVLTAAVRRVLIQMFRFHLIGTEVRGLPGNKVTTNKHANFALVAAEHSIVLLKNSSNDLPISEQHSGSIAVIGTDATTAAASEGAGSAHVMGAFLVKPLSAIEHTIGERNVTFAPGEPLSAHLPSIPASVFRAGSPLPISAPQIHHRLGPGKSDLGIIRAKGVTEAIADGVTIHQGRPGSEWTTWKATIVPPKSGPLRTLARGEWRHVVIHRRT